MTQTRQAHIYDYFIDEHGGWLCEGNPVTDPQLFRVLSRSLFQSEGRYFIRCEGEVHPVRVADAPLWIRYVFPRLDQDGGLTEVELELQDGRRETLDPTTLVLSPDTTALYCLTTPRRLRTRFGKVAYYELARYIEEDEAAQAFHLAVKGRRFDIRPQSGSPEGE
ncbi:MAG: DUF1285 domain-containing protein [Syntrophobacteraceae bacterium]|jgi:hypothetical protein|nr:DUF1285 domain-containing protein [Syntrophobacteraceae bacterium]